MLNGERQPAADVGLFYAMVYAALYAARIVSFSFILNSTISRYTFSFLLVMRFNRAHAMLHANAAEQIKYFTQIENTHRPNGIRMQWACTKDIRHGTKCHNETE